MIVCEVVLIVPPFNAGGGLDEFTVTVIEAIVVPEEVMAVTVAVPTVENKATADVPFQL